MALLFSEPTGSGLEAPDQVFVSGTTVCPGEIVTTPSDDPAYWSLLFDRQPHSRSYVDAPARWLMDWYYLRLLITVVPTEVRVRAPLTASPGDGGGTANGTTSLPGADVLAGFPTAVLSARAPSGAPLLMRTPTTATPEGFLVEPAPDCEVVPGPAALLVHRHDDRLWGHYNAVVPGELRRSNGGGWLLVPQRVIEPSGNGSPRDQLRLLRSARRSTNAYLRRRDLHRPRVDWPALKTLAERSASQDTGA